MGRMSEVAMRKMSVNCWMRLLWELCKIFSLVMLKVCEHF